MPSKQSPSLDEFTKFKNTLKKLLSVSKTELDQIRKEEAAKKKAVKESR